ncbi:MAG: SDR family oxidoreductase [Myxococcales bacterium]|nr:SDR family oxidoreductase [Myxococcales bacterium]
MAILSPRTALITGASAGIGEAFARRLAASGCNLVLTARRQERLEALAAELRRAHGIEATALVADLAEPGAPLRLFQRTEELGLEIDMLVNNAGYGLPGHYVETRWEDQAAFLQVLVTAVCELTHRYLPAMEERGFGRIIHVSSLAGLVPGSAGHTLYSAAKAFLVKFAESLAAEQAGSGVQVTAVCPGFTLSEFHDVTGTRDLVSRMPGYMWQNADEVAAEGLAAVAEGRVLCVTGRVNRAIAAAAKVTPARLAVRVSQARSKDFRRPRGAGQGVGQGAGQGSGQSAGQGAGRGAGRGAGGAGASGQ